MTMVPIMRDGEIIMVDDATLNRPANIVATYVIPKTLPWQRMTTEEAAVIDAVMLQTDAQMKQIYMAAQYLNSGDPLWPVLRQLIADSLPGGGTRADQLLAPET